MFTSNSTNRKIRTVAVKANQILKKGTAEYIAEALMSGYKISLVIEG